MNKPELQRLLQQPHLWQASRVQRVRSIVASGYAELDEQLHYGGWVDNATTELLLPHSGVGELRLLLPGLHRIQSGQRPWLVLINPPFVPYAPTFAQLGLQTAGLLVIQPRNTKDLLWSAEHTLQSGCCGAVLTWTDDLALNHQQLRRLQHAAHRGQSWHVLLRSSKFVAQASPSALRVQLNPRHDGLLQIHILKQRGGWGGQQLALRLQPDLSQLHWHTAEELLQGPVERPQSKIHQGKVIPFPAA